MLKLKDLYDKVNELKHNQYNGTEETAESIEKLIKYLRRVGRLMMELDVYDDRDEEVDDETWDKICDLF